MAASTETVAFIAAGGAIVGSIVGSTVGGTMDFVLDRLREGRRGRVGARMVRVDLSMAASRLKNMEERKRWWTTTELPMNSWKLYEDALTARLDPDSLRAVTHSVVGLQTLSDSMQATFRRVTPTMEYIDVSREVKEIHGLRKDATAAYNALANLAGDRTVAGLLPD